MNTRTSHIILAILCLLPCTSHATPPQRILSLDLCMDWLVAHHAERQAVVALSPLQKRYPIDWIDADWPLHDGSLERIYALQPDLVLVGQYSGIMLRQRLQSLGVRLEVL